MICRKHCGACCIIPAINTPFFGMPEGKPAHVRCTHLRSDYSCAIFGQPERPQVCSQFQASLDVCGDNREQAVDRLTLLEDLTRPER